jgi:UDP-N-acetylglucosamine 2-epimerase (non-hydrolysing)
MKLLHVVGARPNFVKLAPVYAAAEAAGHSQVVVHTGQHYDRNMSAIFFEQFGLPEPNYNLAVGSATQAAQTAEVLLHIEPILLAEHPDWVIVYGDVNSTVAAALAAVKLGLRVAHVEAGLRSFDRSMPEEINRVITDRIADLLLTPSADADEHLRHEGVASERIARVGNVMVDMLLKSLPNAQRLARQGPEGSYGLITLHRPSNVDEPDGLERVWRVLVELSGLLPLVFPVHPRTRAQLAKLGVMEHVPESLVLCEPLGYVEFLRLQADATLIVTDSGGIQEESTVLGVPCLTLRPNTERPITVTVGSNTLIGDDPAALLSPVAQILAGEYKRSSVPELWDGHTALRIVSALSAYAS